MKSPEISDRFERAFGTVAGPRHDDICHKMADSLVQVLDNTDLTKSSTEAFYNTRGKQYSDWGISLDQFKAFIATFVETTAIVLGNDKVTFFDCSSARIC